MNGMYVVSSANLRYIPSASEKYQTTITTTTQPKKGRRTYPKYHRKVIFIFNLALDGIIGTSWAFAKRLLKEASHEIEKVYTVIDDSNAMRRFSKNFQFRDPEPIYGGAFILIVIRILFINIVCQNSQQNFLQLLVEVKL